MATQAPFSITFHDQIAAYDRLAPDFPSQALGRWALIGEEELLGFYDSLFEAQKAASERGIDAFNRHIRQVGSKPPIVLVFGGSS